MKRVNLPFLVFIGLLALAYYLGRRGVGTGVAASIRAGTAGNAKE